MNVEPRLKWQYNIATGHFELGHSKHNAEIKVFCVGFWYPNISLKVLLTFDMKYLFTTFVVLTILNVSNFFREFCRIKILNSGQSAQFL